MIATVVRFPQSKIQPGKIFCEPLKLFFPQLYRIIRKQLLKGATGASPGHSSLQSATFSLVADAGPDADVATIIPIDHLSPSDEHSLLVRHFWTADQATSYMQGAEDHLPDQPLHSIVENGDGIFAVSKCRTRSQWPGPTIFYLADWLQDDERVGVGHWENWIGSDGLLQTGELFYETE
jgi:hypothetical protein